MQPSTSNSEDQALTFSYFQRQRVPSDTFGQNDRAKNAVDTLGGI